MDWSAIASSRTLPRPRMSTPQHLGVGGQTKGVKETMQHSPRHAFSKLGWKARTGAVIGISAGAMTLGAVLPASFASASSFGCNAHVACATLNGHQPDGAFASMDARYQSPTEKVIGYPDNLLDRATSFDKVPHTFRHGVLRGDTYYTFVYAPTGDWSNMCVTANSAGLLNLQVCTHGDSTFQQFVAGQYNSTGTGSITAPAVIPNFDGNRQYVLENVGGLGLDSAASLPSSLSDIRLMEDTYVGSATHPSPNIPHGSSTDARQLDVNGSTTQSASNSSVTNGDAVVSLNEPTVTTHGSAGHHLTATLTGVNVKTNALWNWHT